MDELAFGADDKEEERAYLCIPYGDKALSVCDPDKL